MSKYSYRLSVFWSIITNINWFLSRSRRIVLKNKTIFIYRNFMDLWTIAETYLRHDYTRYLEGVKENWTIIDIGAAIGDFTILASQMCPFGKVFAIEPFPPSFKILQKNIFLNCLKNVTISNIAVASKNGKLSININPKNYGNNSTTENTSKNTVESTTLNQYFTKNKIRNCNLLKCDCEGAEYDIFLNLDKATFSKIQRIVMEYHLFLPSHNLNTLTGLFKKHDFKIKLTPNPVHKNIGFLYAFK